MEGECDREEHGERKDVPREAVCLPFIMTDFVPHLDTCGTSCSQTFTRSVKDQMRKRDTDCSRYNDDLSLEDAIHTALLTLKEGFEGQMTENTIEIGVVTVPTAEQMREKSGERLPPTFRKLTEAEVRDYLAL